MLLILKASSLSVCSDRFDWGRSIAYGGILSTTNWCFQWDLESTLENFLSSNPNLNPSSKKPLP